MAPSLRQVHVAVDVEDNESNKKQRNHVVELSGTCHLNKLEKRQEDMNHFHPFYFVFACSQFNLRGEIEIAQCTENLFSEVGAD